MEASTHKFTDKKASSDTDEKSADKMSAFSKNRSFKQKTMPAHGNTRSGTTCIWVHKPTIDELTRKHLHGDLKIPSSSVENCLKFQDEGLGLSKLLSLWIRQRINPFNNALTNILFTTSKKISTLQKRLSSILKNVP